MRRALLHEWPALSVQYGLHPWNVGGPPELTVRETESYVRAFAETQRARREQAVRR